MAEKISPEQFWKLYKNLPQELKDALFEEETGNNIYEICKRNDISEKVDEVGDLVTEVLLGLLPPEEFSKVLEEKLFLDEALAKKVNHEINRLVFFSVKESLAEIYETSIPSSEKKSEFLRKKTAEKKIGKEELYSKEEKETASGADSYRETVE